MIFTAKGKTVRYERDGNGNITAVTTINSPTGTSPANTKGENESSAIETTRIKYDALNRKTEMAKPDGSIFYFTYDKGGNLTQVSDDKGNTTMGEYDLANQLTKLIDYKGRAATFTYTALGRIESITNAEGETEIYGYDRYGRINKKTRYDVEGRVVALQKQPEEQPTDKIANKSINLITGTTSMLLSLWSFLYSIIIDLFENLETPAKIC